MKSRLFPLALIAICSFSCSVLENDTPVADKGHKSFYAEIEQPSSLDTKVHADKDLKVLWDADDRIAIFDKYTYGFEYKYIGEPDSNAGEFEQIEVDDDIFVMGADIDVVCSVYPYDERLSINNSGSVVTLTLPDSQTYLADSFGKGANTMISMGLDTKLAFKNVCGYLALKFYGDNVSVSSITLKGNNKEMLAGRAQVSVAVGVDPELSGYKTGKETITLNCPEPVKIGDTAENATVFWFAVPPTTFKGGFTVTVKDAAGKEFVKSTTRSFEISRNCLSRMAALKAVMD